MNEHEQIQSEIRGLKQILAQTDYKALKHADGALTDEEYEETRLKRQELRDKINRLEERLTAVEAEGTEGAEEAEETETTETTEATENTEGTKDTEEKTEEAETGSEGEETEDGSGEITEEEETE